MLPQLEPVFGNTDSVAHKEIRAKLFVAAFSPVGQMLRPENHARLPALAAVRDGQICGNIPITPFFRAANLVIGADILNGNRITSAAIIGSNGDRFGVHLQHVTADIQITPVKCQIALPIHTVRQQDIAVHPDCFPTTPASHRKELVDSPCRDVKTDFAVARRKAGNRIV